MPRQVDPGVHDNLHGTRRTDGVPGHGTARTRALRPTLVPHRLVAPYAVHPKPLPGLSRRQRRKETLSVLLFSLGAYLGDTIINNFYHALVYMLYVVTVTYFVRILIQG